MKNATTSLFVVAALMLSSCCVSEKSPGFRAYKDHHKAGGIEHIVLAWLKNPGNKEEQAKLIAAAKALKADIKEVKSLAVGRALPSDRDVVDDSFDMALVMHFDSPEALASYEKDPMHVKAVTDTLKPLTKKIVVHDIVNE